MTTGMSKSKKNRLGWIAVIAGLAGLVACDADVLGPGGGHAAKIVLSSVAEPLTSFGDTAVVAAQVLDQNGLPLQGARLHWSVQPAGVLVQDADGVFRAIANGRVTVVATVAIGQTGVRRDGYFAEPVADSIVIEVSQRPARLLIEAADTAFTTIGATRQLRVRVTDARGNALAEEPPAASWSSAHPEIMSIDASGLVRTVAEGAARVTASAGGLSASRMFTVAPRLPHTSCMVYAQRRQTREACVTLDFVVREREGAL